MIKRPELIIFDFDGVVADSEVLANAGLAEFLTELGRPTTLDDCVREFVGKRHADMLPAVDRWLGRPRPENFEADLRARTSARLRANVQPVDGAAEFLGKLSGVPVCVASSSSRDWLDHCVEKFSFRRYFGDNLFSATEVKNGKPAPDIFLHAAARMGVAPSECLVLEDSTTGVTGACAANMYTIGFLGGSHVGSDHGVKLRFAGAHEVADDYTAVARRLGL